MDSGNSQNKPQLKSFTDKIIIVAILIAVFGSGYRMGERKAQSKPRDTAYKYSVENLEEGNTQNIDFSLFWEAWNSLEQKYVDKKKVDPKVLYYGAIKGMVASVGDSYTFFLTPDENKESKRDLEGKFFGIGAELGLKNNQIMIVTPLKNSPAERAGIKPGDYIIEVDGASTKNWTLFEAVNKIRGDKGTKVALTVVREGADKELKIPVERGEINVPFVEVTYENDVAIVELSRFGDPTNDLWDKISDEIAQKKQTGQIKGMIIDVRGNPGGYLQSAIHISSDFVKKDTVIVKQEYADQEPDIYTSDRDGKLIGMPVVMLMNAGSASAAEIVGGALRDTVGAKIVGENSFGKGTVQTAEDLTGGAGIHITISKWILPKGSWINEKGIKPDYPIENDTADGNTLTRETDLQLNKAVEVLNSVAK
ncbi:S41 family peptidase [Candidatus Woesebacteria bacterium]|nr:S41 family peptidase [Candidatus Woesebacteria bacterium]